MRSVFFFFFFFASQLKQAAGEIGQWNFLSIKVSKKTDKAREP